MKKLVASILLLSLLLTGCSGLLDETPTMDPPSTKPVVTDATKAPTEPTAETPANPITTPPTEAPTEPVTAPPTEAPTEHIHAYSAATCTSPKTCSTCGETSGDCLGHNWKSATCTDPKTCFVCHKTEGEASGHDWKKATCSMPKTCSRCNETSGFAAAHSYTDGICSFCGKSDPEYAKSGSIMVWIPTRGGKKYHTSSDCSNMIDPDYVTLEEAEELGFTPCKRCH